MRRNYSYTFRLITILLVLVYILAACNLPTMESQTSDEMAMTQTSAAFSTAFAATLSAAGVEEEAEELPPPSEEEAEKPAITETPTPTVVHLTHPADPPYHESWMYDPDSSSTASEHRASRGEYYQVLLFERPFNADTMDIYFPDLDITQASLSRDSPWVYVTIDLVGTRSGGGLEGTYGAEIDLDVDGRGDWLIFATAPETEWSTDRVQVWRDTNHDVGDGSPIQSDPPQSGDGYETLVFDSGQGDDPDAAWARVSPTSSSSVEIAFKYSLIGSDNEFMWGAWADQGLVEPGWFDYNDHFSHDEAGSPLSGVAQYPLKAVAEVDNTCRWPLGFTAEGDEPGVCPIPATPTPTVTVTPTTTPSTIAGIVFYDNTGDLIYQSGEHGIAGVEVRVRSGDCGSPGGVVATTTTDSSGIYTASGLEPGTYCVDVPTDPPPHAGSWTAQTGPTTVTLTPGEISNTNFGYFWFG